MLFIRDGKHDESVHMLDVGMIQHVNIAINYMQNDLVFLFSWWLGDGKRTSSFFLHYYSNNELKL
jgi:hypothetical protein